MPELVVIMVVALLVLGPKRLPEVAKGLGKALAELRRATSGISEELQNARVMLEEEAREANRKIREADRALREESKKTQARTTAATSPSPAEQPEAPDATSMQTGEVAAAPPSERDSGSDPPRG